MKWIMKTISLLAYIFLWWLPVNKHLAVVITTFASCVFVGAVFPLRYHVPKRRREMIDMVLLMACGVAFAAPLVWGVMDYLVIDPVVWKDLFLRVFMLSGFLWVLVSRFIEATRIGLQLRWWRFVAYTGLMMVLMVLYLVPGGTRFLAANHVLILVEMVIFGGLWFLTYNLGTFDHGESIR